MNRFARGSVFLAVVLALTAGAVIAQGLRGMVQRKVWYVDSDRKVYEAVYWRIYLGDYDVKLKRHIDGKGTINVTAGMNFQFFSAGYIEGNGHSAEGRMQSLPGMRIRTGGEAVEIKITDIDYIYDYGTKVAAKDGRKGDFLIGLTEADGGGVLEIKRFQFTEYKEFKGSFGEIELKETKDRQPIVALAFSKEAAAKAASEAVSA
jgi:hypothetical protein